MSESEVMKAEMKARRSSRELEVGLDHLADKIGEVLDQANGVVSKGMDRAQAMVDRALQLRDRAGEVADKVRHPKETVTEYVGERMAVAKEKVQHQLERMPERRDRAVSMLNTQFTDARKRYEALPPRSKQILLGSIAASMTAFIGYMIYRSRKSVSIEIRESPSVSDRQIGPVDRFAA